MQLYIILYRVLSTEPVHHLRARDRDRLFLRVGIILSIIPVLCWRHYCHARVCISQ